MPSTVFQTILGGPFLTGYLLYLGASSSEVGFVLAVTTLVNVAQIIIAFLIQRLQNRKWTLVVFVALHRFLWCATGLIPFLFDREWWIPAFIMLYISAFLANTVVGVLWTSLISDIVPAGVRGRYFGIRNTFLNALGSLTLFVGGKILDGNTESKGFMILFIIAFIFAAWNVMMFLFYPDKPFERSAETKFMPMVKRPLRDQSFMKASWFLAAWLFLQTLVVPLYSYVMLDLMNINYSTVSLFTVVQTVAMMGSFYVWGNLNARFSNKRLLYWTLPIIAASCLSWGLLSIMPVIPVLLLSHALLGVGVGGFNQLAFNFIIGDTPKSERPMFIGMYSALTGMTSFLGPLAGGWIYKLIVDLPIWMQQYGLQTAVGAVMVGVALTYGRSILRNS